MTLGGYFDAIPEGSRYAAARGARAAVVGVAFGSLMAWILADTARCEAYQQANHIDGFGCMGGGLAAFFVLPVLSFPVGWLLLRWLDVRPAWAVALLAAIVSRATLVAVWSLTGHRGHLPPAGVVVVCMTVGYVASALLVAPRLRLFYRVTAGVVVLGAAALGLAPIR